MLKIRLFPILILILGLVLTLFVSYSVFHDKEKLEKQAFRSVCLGFESQILQQLNVNAQILYSSASFIASSDTITRSEWKQFQNLNKSHRELPGIQGIGYSIVVYKPQLAQFEKQIQKEGFVDFKVKPEGDRDFYTSVLYLEPFSGRNLKAFGYDGYAEPVRQKAMMLARDNDIATISDKVILRQESEEKKQAGAIMFVPVFKTKSLFETHHTQQAELMGWVYSPFRMNDFLTGLLDTWNYHDIRFRVFDNMSRSSESLLFDSDSVFQVNHADLKTEIDIPLNFNGKIWTLNFRKYAPASFWYTPQVIFVFMGGTITSVLLFVLAISLINARTRSLQIHLLNEELKKADANKDRFISVLAHDLKSPFNTLLGFSEILDGNMDDLTQSEVKSYSKQIHIAAKSTYALLEELLMWARVQSGQFPFNPKVQDINQLCKSIVADHFLTASKKNIQICFDETTPTQVKADELMIKTVMRNLLTNAIKFTHEKGFIHVRLAQDAEKVTVSVSDTGIGISAKDQAKLFDITQVYSKPGTANERGTGLGLLLCKDLVARHGGTIWVESIPWTGSTFCFTIPLV